MAWTTTIGDKFTHAEYWPLIASTITADANLLAALDGTVTSHPSWHHNREEDANLDQGGFITCSDSVTSLSMSPTEVTTALRFFNLRTEICDFSNQYDTYNNQEEVQIQSLLKKAGRAMEYFAINGDGSSPNPKGIKNQVDGSHTVDHSGAALTLAALDDLYDTVKERSNNMAWIAPPQLESKIRQLARGNDFALSEIELPNGVQASSFRGYPVIRSEFVERNENGGTDSSIYLVNLDFPAGQGYGMVMGEPKQQRNALPGTGPFQIFEAGHSDSKAASFWFVQARIAFVLHSLQGAARLKGVSTS